jgi:hypothetical protein
MKGTKTYLALLLTPAMLGVVALPGCSTSPPTEQGKENLHDEAGTTLNEMYRADPSLRDFVGNRGYAYAIFPEVGKGGVGVGGAYGRGEVYEQGQFVGYADMTQGTIGAQLGGQTYDELIVFQNKEALERFKSNKMEFTAGASGVALKQGAATTTDFNDGVAVFTRPRGGVMFEAVIGGQQFSYQQTGGPDNMNNPSTNNPNWKTNPNWNNTNNSPSTQP